jgi:Flp pilus assembly protein TadG
MKHSAEGERGQAIVILAFAMVVLLLIAALAIDGGNAYVERRRSQNAADAAALAGARQMWIQRSVPNPDGTYDNSELNVLRAINQAAVSNGVDGTTSGINPNVVAFYTTNADGTNINPNQVGTLGFIPPNVTGLRVKAIRQFGQNFGGLLRQSPNASAQATAVIVPPPPCNSWGIYATNSVMVSGGGQGINMTNGGVYAGNDLACDTTKATVAQPYAWQSGNTVGNQCNDGENGNTVIANSPVPSPEMWDYADFLPGGPINASLGSNYHAIGPDDTISADGLYFLSGDARHLNIAPNVRHVTIVANGLIQFSGGISLGPYFNGLLLFSNAPGPGGMSVDISGSNLVWEGLVYAPRGSVSFQGSQNVSISGSIVAQDVKLTGAGTNINFDPASCVPQRATVKLLKFGE